MEGFFGGCEIFNFRIFFLVGKFWQVFFGVFKPNVSIFHVTSLNVMTGDLAWTFLGVKFWSRDFFGF